MTLIPQYINNIPQYIRTELIYCGIFIIMGADGKTICIMIRSLLL